jgi:hypothetical protein
MVDNIRNRVSMQEKYMQIVRETGGGVNKNQEHARIVHQKIVNFVI